MGTPRTRTWSTERKVRAFTAASSSGLRACRLWSTETTSCKRKGNVPLTASFQHVANARKGFR